MKIIISILILLFSWSSYFAHNCSSYSQKSDEEYSKEMQKFDAIFYGEVVAISEVIDERDAFNARRLEIRVLRSWKGVESERISLLYNRAYTTFEREIGSIGTKKIFYAYKRDNDSNLYVDFCSFSSFDDERIKREYGEGKVLEQPKTEVQTNRESESFLTIIWQKIISFFS